MREYGGKILVISGEQVTDAYDTIEEALQGAIEKHGLNNVLIRGHRKHRLSFLHQL